MEFGKSKNEILSNISQDYETFENDKKFKELNIDEQFFENHFLGFSYLIPQEDQQKYFSSVFRNINENGTKLSSLETRKALYFLKDGTDSLFDPDCIKKIYIEKVLIQIMLPLAAGTMSAIFVLNFIAFWNDWNINIVYMPSFPMLAYALYSYQDTVVGDAAKPPAQTAGCMLVALPMFVMFVVFRKTLMGNLTIGGIKG